MDRGWGLGDEEKETFEGFHGRGEVRVKVESVEGPRSRNSEVREVLGVRRQ